MLRNGHVRFGGRPGKPTSCKGDRAPGSGPYTFARTWHGFRYTVFRHRCLREEAGRSAKKIVGWAVSATLRTEKLPLREFNHAVRQLNSTLSELVNHSDRGSQYLSLAYTHWPNLGSLPRSGHVAKVMTAAAQRKCNPAYKTELINRVMRWRCIDVELSTAQWIRQEPR